MPRQTSPATRKSISWLVVGLGVAVGIVYLLFVAPIFLFTIGKNDAWTEVLAMLLVMVSTLPASLVAIFSRKRAGIWLVFVSVLGAAANALNTFRALNSKGIEARFGEVFGSTLLDVVSLSIGLFFWLTGSLGWTNLRQRAKRQS